MSDHPEEMKCDVALKFGDVVSFTATARTTPAGLLSTAVLIAACMIPLVMLLRRR